MSLIGLPLFGASLMSIVWISTLGGTPIVVLTGILIGIADFFILLIARSRLHLLERQGAPTLHMTVLA